MYIHTVCGIVHVYKTHIVQGCKEVQICTYVCMQYYRGIYVTRGYAPPVKI